MKKIFIFLSLASYLLSLNAEGNKGMDYKEISADKINYNVKSGALATEGKTEIIGTTGQKITLLDAYLSKTGAGGGNVLIEWDERTLITAETFDKDGGLTRAGNITYTACHNCDPVGTAWTVHATKLTHDSDAKEMYFYNFWFDMYGVPILYLPVLVQPDPTVKYRSGLLIPEFSSASNMGTGVHIPLYINFSDSHDMTVTGVYLTNADPLVLVEHRLRADHSSFDTTGSSAHIGSGSERWHIFHRDTIELGENARLRTLIQRASDKTYLQQYGFYDDQPFLESNAKLELFGERGYATVDANVFQELRSETPSSSAMIPRGDILPKVHGVYQVGFWDRAYGRVMGDVMRISDIRNDWSATRALGEARIIAPIELAWQRFTLSAAARSDHYQYDNMISAAGEGLGYETRFLPSGYVDWEMPFVKSGDDWTQIVKPKARVTVLGKSNNDNFLNLDSAGALLSDSSLFANNRYAGYDSWVNGTYADYGVSWTGYDADGHGAEFFIGQTYDMDTDREPDANSGYRDGASDLVGRVGLNPLGWLNITNRFRLGKEEMDLRHTETDVRVGTIRNFFSVGYIWAMQFSDAGESFDSVSEVTAGAGIYLTNRLVFRGLGVYNLTDRIPQRYNAGMYYEHPCYTLGFIYSVDNAMKKDNNYDEELNFRGVSSFKMKFSIKMGR